MGLTGDTFLKALILQYLLASLWYAWEHSYWKALYFLSATGISIAVLRMR